MRVLFIVLGLIGAACAVPRQSRIVGGESTTIENYPFSAAVITLFLGRYIQFCGGTLITPTSIVSAAHCFEDGSVSHLRIRLGSTYASFGGSQHFVSRIIEHPQYDSYLIINDISIVKLSVPAVFSNKINRARIAGPGYFLPVNTVVNAIGWGDTKFQGQSSDILQHVAVNVIDHQICTERYEYLKTLPDMWTWPDVTPEMLCTGILDVGGKDACQGDSGGPIIHNRDVLVGVTSWGYKCGDAFYPGVSMRVSSFTDWIYTNSIN